MKIKNSELKVLSEALGELGDIDTKFEISYAGAKSFRKVEEAIMAFEKDRIYLVEMRAKKDENNKPIVDREAKKYVFETPEIEKEVQDDIAKLLDSEVDVDLHSMPKEKFYDIEEIKGSLVFRLGKFIEE